MTLRVRKRYCRRCTHCACNRDHSRDHWTGRRAVWVAVGLLALILACAFGCVWPSY